MHSICRLRINTARTATAMAFWHFGSEVAAGNSTETEKINKITPYKPTSKQNILELGIKVGLRATCLILL